MNTQSLRTCVLAALFSIGPVTHAASSSSVTRSTTVSLSGIDLSTSQGRSEARGRLHEAARRECAQVADDLDLSHQANFVACVDNTLAAALAQLDAPTRAVVAEKSASWGIATVAPAKSPMGAEPLKTRATTVSLADLDLSTPKGVSTARERVNAAARRLCSQVRDIEDRSSHSNYVECVNESTLAAMRQLPGPALAAVDSASGRATP